MAERRAASKGKSRETYPPADVKSQTSREKVMDWKARLCTPSEPSSTRTVHSSGATFSRTPLGFPVAKHSSLSQKEAKNKTPNSSLPNERAARAEAEDSNERQNNSQGRRPAPEEQNISIEVIATNAITALGNRPATARASERQSSPPHMAPEISGVTLGIDLGAAGPLEFSVRHYYFLPIFDY